MRLVNKIIRWLLAAGIILFIVSGFGITEFRTVEALTFGLLPKILSFKIHTHLGLGLSFLVLLVFHTYSTLLSPILKTKKGKGSVQDGRL